jgi:16S rRNA (cytosine1407-C5)-methyltransferase
MDQPPVRYRDMLSTAEFERLLRAVQRPLPPAIRINTLKIAVDDACRTWPAQYGWQVQPIPFCEAGWQVTGDDVAKTLEHKMGFYYIQDAASMLPGEMFGFASSPSASPASILSPSKDAGHGSVPRHGDAPGSRLHPSTSSGCLEPLVLDMAAAPGGKTTHLVCKTGDCGLVIANDANGARIPPLRAKLQDWGAMNAAITRYPGEQLGGWFPDTFDKVLLDAPCSGESLRTAERRKMQPVSDRERQKLHRRQVELLVSAFQALKPGGELIYATCSLAPEEDEAVLDALLGRYPNRATIEVVDHVLPTPAPALTSDGARAFHPQVARAVRLWPHLYDTSGFFAAKIGKQDSVDVQPSVPPARPLESAGFAPLDRPETARVCDRLFQVYGFDLTAVVERQALALWGHAGVVYAIPELFLAHFADLPCVMTGMRIGEQGDGEFVPSHELVARFGAQFSRRRLALSDEQAAVWLGGRDLRGLESRHPMGATILLEDGRGRFLGLGQVQTNRIRNLLPRRLVY